MHYLDHHARKGTAYLHPGGAGGTECMIHELDLKPGMKILEIGCGTGASSVRIAKHFQVQYTAADISESMLSSARQRATMEGCQHKIAFVKLLRDGKLPFADHSFDVVFAESVLGIMDETLLPVLLKEISRVLTPTGMFASNDAIWKDQVSEHDIKKINAACLHDFGIIQSLSSPANLQQWQTTFTEAGFFVKKIIEVPPVKSLKNKQYNGFFQYYKKLMRGINIIACFREFRYNKALKNNHQHDYAYLSSYIFVLQNHKGSSGRLV
ncbi:MAG: methyltransferase domain-containing protein [Bacteroidetes bacterium]|nr:methyltransferase domain-containing protein [Bacteroidota bacterium]